MTVTRREFLGTTAVAASAATLGLSWASRTRAKTLPTSASPRSAFTARAKATSSTTIRISSRSATSTKRCCTTRPTRSRKNSVTSSNFTPTSARCSSRKDVDAVSIATPNHLHALIAISAAQAGKHVYVEKPASHNIWEGRQMIQAARQNNRIMQCGTQCALQLAASKRRSLTCKAASSARSSTPWAPATSRAPASASSTSRSRFPARSTTTSGAAPPPR